MPCRRDGSDPRNVQSVLVNAGAAESPCLGGSFEMIQPDGTGRDPAKESPLIVGLLLIAWGSVLALDLAGGAELDA